MTVEVTGRGRSQTGCCGQWAEVAVHAWGGSSVQGSQYSAPELSWPARLCTFPRVTPGSVAMVTLAPGETGLSAFYLFVKHM